MRLLFLLFFIVVLQPSVNAQLKETSSLELPIDSELYSYSSLGLKEGGILLYREMKIKHSNLLELVRIDTALTIVWRSMLNLKDHSKFISIKSLDQHIWMLFRDEKAPYDFQVYKIDLSDGHYKMINIDEKSKFIPLSFTAGEKFLLVGGIEGRKLVFLHHSLVTHRSHFLSGYSDIKSELSQISQDSSENIEIVLTSKKRESRILLLTFSANGELLSEVPINSDTHSLSSVRLIHTPDSNRLLFGTYRKLKSKSRGIFSALINSENQAGLKYYDFSHLKHFYQSSTEMNADVDPNRKIRSSNQNYNFYLQQPLEVREQYFVIANSFTPIFSKPIQQYMRSPITAARMDSLQTIDQMGILSAFKMAKSLVLLFDKQGNLKADDSFPLENTSLQLENVVAAVTSSESNKFFFLRNDRIVSRTQLEGRLSKPTLSDPIIAEVTPSLQEKIKLKELSKWYKDHLYCTGVIIVSRKNTNIAKFTYQFVVKKLKVNR